MARDLCSGNELRTTRAQREAVASASGEEAEAASAKPSATTWERPMSEAQQAASASARMDSASSSAHKSSPHSSDTDRELQARPTRHKARSVPVAASASTWDARTPLGLTARQFQLQGRAPVATASSRCVARSSRQKKLLSYPYVVLAPQHSDSHSERSKGTALPKKAPQQSCNCEENWRWR